jgi:NAD(P)-dependent dehydrogenase (short-subunit alcohol dehydrogenase family)
MIISGSSPSHADRPNSSCIAVLAIMGGQLGFLYRQLSFTPKPLPSSESFEGKIALITGANIGLGFATACELASHNLSQLIIAVRDPLKGEAAKESILKTSPDCKIEVWPVDYDNYESIVNLSKRAEALDQIHYVLLSAGLKKLEYSTSHTGHEMNVQINHLGTSLLSLLLLPILQKSARITRRPSRLTIVSSEGHFWIPFKERTAPRILARMDEPQTFGTAMQRYYTTKLLNVLWTRELASRVGEGEVIINTVNPGFCYSGLHRYEKTGITKVVLWLIGWTTEQGGHCLANALVEHENSHGKYLSEQQITEYGIPSIHTPQY